MSMLKRQGRSQPENRPAKGPLPLFACPTGAHGARGLYRKALKAAMAGIALLGAWQFAPLAALASEAGGAAKSPLAWDPDLAIFTGIIFLCLLVVLTLFAWKPLMAGLDQREQSIADMIDDAKRGAEEAAEKLEAYERKLQAAAVEAQEVVAKARKDASVAGEKMLQEARADADRERKRALADIEAAKNEAVQEIANQSTNLAFTLARKLIRKELNPEDHAALVRESLEQFPSEN